ncbi:MAG: response regulator transcription factor, partial [Roseiflexus sp.]
MTNESPISEREREILRLVATGATNQQIAFALNISTNTVKVHLRNIFAKIGVQSRTEATIYAIRTGIVTVKEAGIPDFDQEETSVKPGSIGIGESDTADTVDLSPTPESSTPSPVALSEEMTLPDTPPSEAMTLTGAPETPAATLPTNQ